MSLQTPTSDPSTTAQSKSALTPAKNDQAFRPAAAPALSLWTLLKALRRRWLPALVLGVICGGLIGALVWMLVPPPKHTVRALLHVPSYHFQPIPLNDGQKFENFQRSQVAHAKSRFVLVKAVGDPKVKNLSVIAEHDDAIQWLEKELQVDFSISPETMRISMRGTKTDQLEVLINAITAAYVTEVGNKDRTEYLDKLEAYRKAHRGLSDKLQKKKTDVRALLEGAQAGSASTLALRHEMQLDELKTVRSEHAAVTTKLRAAHLELEMLVAPLKATDRISAYLLCAPASCPSLSLALAKLVKDMSRVTDAPSAPSRQRIEELVAQDLELRKLVGRETDVLDRIRAHERVNPKDSPQGPVDSLKEELAGVRKKKDARRAEILPGIIDKLRVEMGLSTGNDVTRAQVQVNFLTEFQRVLKREIDSMTEDLKGINKSHLDVGDLKYDVATLEASCASLAKSIDAMEANAVPERVKSFESAVTYAPESKITHYAMIGLGGFGAFALVALAFAFFEFRTQRLSAPDQVSQHVGLQLVGTVPHHDELIRARKQAGGRYDTVLSDSVDAVRTTLLFMSRMEGVRSVLVTSAVAGEGKTSSATHLAASLARAGRNTLLVDCDIRNPVAHRVFKVQQAPGLSEVLRGEVELAAAIAPTEIDGLSILPAGNGDPLALQVLALDSTAALFQEFKTRFDFVVVDSSPVLPVPDALLVAQHVDAVVFSVLRDVSTLPKLQAAYRRLGTIGVRILGAIFNGSKAESYTGSYSYSFANTPE